MAADKGTRILDEIGDISPSIQAKLLKFLQDKEVTPVGSSISKKTDVRIIALAYLTRQTWSGNVRELLNYVRRLAVFSNGKTIDLALINLVEGKLYQTPVFRYVSIQALNKTLIFCMLRSRAPDMEDTSLSHL
jgi:DNA-binding NtrC family response regulator